MFELDNIKNETILWDFLIFEVDNIKNETILRYFLQKWKVECRADGLVPMRFAIFPVHLSKVLRLPRKSDARSYEVLHLARKIISANLKIWCSKMQPLSGNQRPDLLTALMNMPLVQRLPRKMHLCRSSSNVPRLPSFWKSYKTLRFSSLLTRCTIPCTCHETTSERPKVARTCGVFNISTSKCASRHNGVHFFDISTSKSGPNLVCFVLFDFENVLRATTACTFSTLKLPKVVRAWCVLLRTTMACNFSSLIWPTGSAPAALASLLFDPPEPQIIGKTPVFRDFPTFSRTCILSSDSFSSLIFSLLLFSMLLLRGPPLFFICPHCRKFDF